MRLTKEQLNDIKSKYNVDDLWSWSRYSTYLSDTYEYYLKYIKHIKGDRNDSAYAPIGTAAHDIIESYHNGNIVQSDMLGTFNDKMFELLMSGVRFDRTDDDKNKSVGDKYQANLEHFFTHYHKPNCKTFLEEFILVKVNPEIYMQGYIDCLHMKEIDNKKHIYITDFKTSSIYKGNDLLEKSGQLKIYAEGIHQKTNLSYNQIHIQFHFLKYVNVTITQANGKTKVRQLERNNYVEKLESSIKMWLKKCGYGEDYIFDCLDDCISNNSLDYLPQDVRNKFIVDDCYVEIDFTENDIVELKNNIIETINEIKEKTNEYNSLKDTDKDVAERVWWQEVTDKSSFFMANLSDYSAKIHKPYAEYLENKEMFLNKDNNDDTDDDDLSWLEGLLED